MFKETLFYSYKDMVIVWKTVKEKKEKKEKKNNMLIHPHAVLQLLHFNIINKIKIKDR